MSVEYLENYESWQLDIPELPKRSFLFSLKPIGLGTPAVESFTSYLNRLADIHGLSVTSLIRYQITSLFKISDQPFFLSLSDEMIRLAMRGLYSKSPLLDKQAFESWLGKTQHVDTVVQVLKKLTDCPDIPYLPLLPMREWYLNLSHIFCSEQRWCAGCYQDSKEAGLPIYNPLLWALKPVTVCPYHQRYLQLNCLCCGGSQTFFNTKDKKTGYCRICGAWLGRFVDPPVEPKGNQFDWDLWLAQAIGKILAAMPQKTKLTANNHKPIAVYKYKPSLTAFLRKCYKLKINPVDGLEFLGIIRSTTS